MKVLMASGKCTKRTLGVGLPGPPHLPQPSHAGLWSPPPSVPLVGLSAGTFALELSASETLCGYL